MRKKFLAAILSLQVLSQVSGQHVRQVWLDELPIKVYSGGIPAVVAGANQGGQPIRMAGKTYAHGVGVASTSILAFHLKGDAVELTATVGVDDMGIKDLPHRFYVLGDKKILFASGDMRLGDRPKRFRVDLRGVQRMGMLVEVKDKGYTRVFSNWADARISLIGDAIPAQFPNEGDRYILTPPASDLPRINSPSRFGVRPGNPFLYGIAASGQKPMTFHASKLPQGLRIDGQTGIITGSIAMPGNYVVRLKATNKSGEATKMLRIVVGDTIALTPPMGWNGWNSWARNIDGEKVLASAKAMVQAGLKDHGWTYVNIDDAWQGKRGGAFHALQANAKFPDFKGLIDAVHAMGLKLGLYSTPWITSYAGYPGGSSDLPDGDFPDSVRDNKRAYRHIGKYRFEEADARQMAAWGVDYLKYDWRIERESAERMSRALSASGRDIVYSLSNSAPFDGVQDWVLLANLYRTGPDIRDSWHGLYETTFTLDKWGPYGGPGHWNDPDMMIVGNVTTGIDMHPTRLTPDEQYSHVSLFALLSAPMLIGCPIEQLDPFTLNLLTNDEVIEIDQDALGKSARLVSDEHGIQVWKKPLEDGSYAVGLFHTAQYATTPDRYFRWGDEQPADAALVLSKLGLQGNWEIRDVWRQKNLGSISDSMRFTIPYHGVVLLKLSAPVPEAGRTIWLDELLIQSYSEGIRPLQIRRNYQNDSMFMRKVHYQRGIGSQSVAVLAFQTDGHARRFSAIVGADDRGNKDIAVQFHVLGDGKVLFESGPMMLGDEPKKVDVDLTGIRRVGLLVTDSVGGIANKRTYSNWADARFIMEGDHMVGHVPNDGERYMLTPLPGRSPRINSAKIFGATPGNPFLYKIAATGEKPLTYAAAGLPSGLRIDPVSGIISGSVPVRGQYRVMLSVRNSHGKASMPLRVCIGDTIALTPPIGWNGWNSWANAIDREKVIASAEAMVSKGLADHGWTYINIDDAWQGKRGGMLNALQSNEKFPDIGGMVDRIHAMGLKAGIYSTPYISSYAGYVGASSDSLFGGETHASIIPNRRAFNRIGKYRFEENDAKQMAAWGFDFLKYDWRIDVQSAERMSSALRRSGRDIVFSLSNSAPFEKVKDWMRVSNMYRTGPDIRDSWTSLYLTVFSLDKWGPYGGPGHWNDADMMIVGNVTTGPEMHPTRLTPDEQYTHISIFSLLAAPMLIGCPIEQLDSFTLQLLTNDEVIAIDQDPLGKPARLVRDEDGVQTWMRPLEDGSYAVGLFYTDDFGRSPRSYFRWGNEPEKTYQLRLSTLGLEGRWTIRDVWRQQDINASADLIDVSIRHHGVVLLTLKKAAR